MSIELRSLVASLLASLCFVGCQAAPQPPVVARVLPSAPPGAPVDPVPLGLRALESFLATKPPPSLADVARARLAALYATSTAGLSATDASDHHKRALALFETRYADATDDAVKRSLGLAMAEELRQLGDVAHSVSLLGHVGCSAKYATWSLDDAPTPLPQDHDATYWNAWESVHVQPIDLVERMLDSHRPKTRFRPAPGGPQTESEEIVYRSPYEGCDDRGDAVARAFLALGEHHRAEDVAGGPFAKKRATSAFEAATRSATPGTTTWHLATLLLGLAYEAEDRHAAGTKTLLHLLSDSKHPVEAEAPALHAIGRSLTFFDFEGPRAKDPAIPRADVLDSEPSPQVAQRKMHVGIDRLRDPSIVPPDAPLLRAIYAGVAREYREVMQLGNELETLRILWSLPGADDDLPHIARAWIEAATMEVRMARAGTRASAEGFEDLADAWARTATLGKGSAWDRKNGSNEPAIAARDALFLELPGAETNARLAAADALLREAYRDENDAALVSANLADALAELDRIATTTDPSTADRVAIFRTAARSAMGESISADEWRDFGEHLHATTDASLFESREEILERAKRGAIVTRGSRTPHRR